MRIVLHGLVGILSAFLLFVACESEDCSLTSGSYCGMVFVNGSGKEVKLNDSLTVMTDMRATDTLYVYISPTDTVRSAEPIDSLVAKGYNEHLNILPVMGVILNRKYGATSVELPMSYTEEEDVYYFNYSKRFADTLWIKHLNYPYFTSMECGTVMHYRITEVRSTNHLIDSVRVVATEVTNTLKKNVKIYYTVFN